MFWGDALKSAWNAATDEARSLAQRFLSGAQKVVKGVVAVADEAKASGKFRKLTKQSTKYRASATKAHKKAKNKFSKKKTVKKPIHPCPPAVTADPAKQQSGGPADKPVVKSPVTAKLPVPTYVYTSKPVETKHIYCAKIFSDTVLSKISTILAKRDLALVHVGVYVPRKARKANGEPIVPERWSNHAYGEAMDFKGVITDNGKGKYLSIPEMKEEYPDLLQEIQTSSRDAILRENRRPEIVDEGGWIHIGLFPD